MKAELVLDFRWKISYFIVLSYFWTEIVQIFINEKGL